MTTAQTQRTLPIPKSLSLTGNLANNWKIFSRDWDNYEIASKLSDEDMKIRVATFLTCIGSDAMNIFDGFDLTETKRKNLNDIKTAFEKYCIGETNETYERFIFNSRNQKDQENVEAYMAELRKLSRSCKFGNLEESILRDRLVMGIRCDITRRKLLQESKLTLTKAIDIARSIEVSKGQMTKIKQKTDTITGHVHKVKYRSTGHQKEGQKNKSHSHSSFSERTCHFCGKNHVLKKELCPAYGKTCNACKGKNHFAKSKYCRKKNVRVVTDKQNSDSDISEEQDFFLSAVGTGKPKTSATLEVNDIQVKFQLDTGSDVNTICQRYVRKDQLIDTSIKLTMWNQTKLKPIGEAILNTLNPKTQKSYPVKYIVVPNSLSCLLGIETMKALNFITFNEENYIGKVEASTDLGDLGEVTLKLDNSSKPRQLPCRKIPFALQDSCKKELNTLVERGILAPVTEPTEWVSQMALAEKQNGKLRICIDPAPLNEALQREHYKLPTLDDVLYQLKDAKVFTKLDIKEAFWHVRLDEESSLLTTMITPFGRFRWLRLPFGLKVSSEIFQRKLTEALEGLTNTISVADDIILAGCGKDKQEASDNLKIRTEQLNQRCKERNIILNDKKTDSEKTEIIFMGHQITSNGIAPDPSKVSAIQNIPRPTDVAAVRRLCGVVQYLSRFIPNLCQHTEPLRKLTRKDTEWNWTTECEQAFDNIKRLIAEDTKLAYFDPDKDLFIQVDSSKDGVGCVIHQEGRPIEYASKTLTETQRRWAQIEKELLSVVIGLERFDQYTYGRKVVVQNDHKPLEHILKKPMSQAPRRLQNLLMRLHRYDIEFRYVEGSKLYIADTLSRAVGSKETHEIPDLQIHSVTNIADSMMEQIRQATNADETLMKLMDYTIYGWPEKQDCHPSVMPFKQIKDSISIENDILYKGEQAIIPLSLRPTIKEKLHAAHLGYDSMMRRVRSTVYWPGIQHEIQQLAENCDPCQRRKPSNQKETLQQHEEGTTPWDRVGIDFFYIKGRNYLVVVDYYSNFLEVEYLRSTGSSQTINKLKQIFARWGIPRELVSDNGPQLVSVEFETFLKEWGITHKTSDPMYPKGNGKAESAVKTIKNMLKKCEEGGEDPYKALLELRNTPRQDVNMSPAQIMMGRQIRTMIPHKQKYSPPSPTYEKLRAKRQQSVIETYNKNAKDLKPIPMNNPVYFKDPNNKWQPGKVTQRKGRSYNILSENGNTYRRNRVHLREKQTPFDNTFEAVLTTPNQAMETHVPLQDPRRSTRPRQPPNWQNDYITE